LRRSEFAADAGRGAVRAATGQPNGADRSGADRSGAEAKPKQERRSSKDKSGQEAVTSGTSKDRLFFALPNFLTVDANGKIIR